MRRQGGFFYWVKIIIILAIVGAGFFCAQKVWAALNNENVVIYEVYGGGGNSGAVYKNDYIVLYNPTDGSISLNGWSVQYAAAGSSSWSVTNLSGSIAPKGFYLIQEKAGSGGSIELPAPDAVGTIILSAADGKLALVNDINKISSQGNNNVVDFVGYGKANEFEGNKAAPAPSNTKSIERQPIGQDTNDNSADFFIQENPTPRNLTTQTSPPPFPSQGEGENTASSTNLTPPSPSQGEGGNTASTTNSVSNNPPTPLLKGGVTINFGDAVVNELVSDPADNEVEWIELYNRSGQSIDLSGWWIEDGSKTKTNLSGSLDKYKIIEKPNGNLNNNGDLIALYDATGKIIDQLAYGNWPDGNLDDNAPVARDPNSMARKFDGYNSFNNANDFAVTIKPTKGAANLIEAEDEVSAEAKAKFDFSPDIYISELLPNPTGDDSKLEFMEIFNAGRRTVDLSGWSLSNENGKKFLLDKAATSALIQAGEYLALFRPKTKIVLHNDQGEVRLFQPLADKASRIVEYKDVEEGRSYNNARGSTSSLEVEPLGNVWTWSETVTPGAKNVIKAVNHAPEVSFSFKAPALVNTPVIFDSSDSSDADGDELKYSWDFGDGFKNVLPDPDHTYLKTGIYKVKLAVSDGKEIGEKEKSIKVVGAVGEIASVLDCSSALTSAQKEKTGCLRGNDKIEGGGEEVVIINEILPNPEGADTGQEWLELKNQGAQKINLLNWRVENSNGKYKFADNLWLEAGNFYVLNNAVSQLAFKNSSDVINLYNNLDELAGTVEYADAVQGESYARGANGNWFWTTKLTPGSENAISVASAFAKATADKGSNNEKAIYVETDLEKVRELEVGSLVKVKGTVAVEPGILGAQIFYITGSPGLPADAKAMAGKQIYNYKKDFPALKVGDYVEVRGELALVQGELRIKTKEKIDIKIAGHKPPPAALAVASDAVNEDNAGQLVVVSGEITDKKSSTIYLDDGNDEVLVYIKKNTGISTKNLALGQTVAVTGIVSKTSSGIRLMPRSKEDIVAISQNSELTPQVLGEVASGNEWEVAGRDKKSELFKYLLIIAGGAIIVLAGLFIKARKKS